MAKTAIKEVHVNFPKKEYLQFFIEVLSSALKHVEFILSYKHNVVKVKLFGERDSVFQSVNIVKTLSKMLVRSVTPNTESFYSHHLKLIQQIGNRIVSLDSLSSALYHSGIPSSVRDQELITKANMEEVQSVLAQLYDLVQELPLNIRTQIMKRVILTISYCTDLSPKFVIEKGLEMSYFQQTSNSITISQDPITIIENMINQFSDENSKSEQNEFFEIKN